MIALDGPDNFAGPENPGNINQIINSTPECECTFGDSRNVSLVTNGNIFFTIQRFSIRSVW